MNVREWALPVYTILMQLAVGTLLSLWLIRALVIRQHGQAIADHIVRFPVLAILLTIFTAIIGSHFHLSRPYFSLLALLNFSSSWLSREVAFTLSFSLIVSGLTYLQWFTQGHFRLKSVLGWLAIMAGSLGVYSMSKIYLLPTHSSWNSPLTVITFLLSVLILGVTAVAVLLVMDLKVAEVAGKEETAVRHQIIQHSFVWLAGVAGITAVIILTLNLILIAQFSQGDTSAQTSLVLLLGLYQPLFSLRFITLFTGISWFGLTVFHLRPNSKRPHDITKPIYLTCLFILIAEIMGRFLFYATHVRMGL